MTIAPDVPGIDLAASVAEVTQGDRIGDVVPLPDVLDESEIAALAEPAPEPDYDAEADAAEKEYQERLSRARQIVRTVDAYVEALQSDRSKNESDRLATALKERGYTQDQYDEADELVRQADAIANASKAEKADGVDNLLQLALDAAERNAAQ